MKHYGDITKIDWSKVEPVDCVTGGSPCQDLSVAGKRAGLAGERSGLFMEQIRCIKELRKQDELRGRTGQLVRPRYMVWENVPGAFSSGTPKGSDFAAVIEEIVKVCEPNADVCVCVPDNGWTKAGCYYAEDGRWSIAWRVHDAQFWGVPQRRKRIALVADFGGLSAPEVLFERKGLSRDFEPSGAQREEATGTIGKSVESASGVVSKGNGECFLTDETHTSLSTGGGQAGQGYPCVMQEAITFQERAGCAGGGKGILIQNEKTGALSTLNNQSVALCYAGVGITNPTNASRPKDGDPCHTLSEDSRNYVVIETDQKDLCVEMTSTKNTIYTNGICPTLTARMGTGGGQVNAVLSDKKTEQEPLCSDVSATLDASYYKGCGNRSGIERPFVCVEQEPCYPDIANPLAARYDGSPQPDKGNGANIVAYDAYQHHGWRESETCGTMTEKNNVFVRGDTPLVCGNQNGNEFVPDVGHALKAKANLQFREDSETYIATAVDCRNGTEKADVNGCLQAKEQGQNLNSNNVCRCGSVVRRLTPLECERLQGYPDGWTSIGEWVDSKGKKHKDADSPRYKALGNSIALPFWVWLLRRISAQYERPATLGSLFDGIGGFPLCWERCNGKGTALWASEIEEFPIAVTKRRFGED